MLKNKLILAVCVILMLIPTTVFAATDYTITIRAGSNNVKGVFTETYKNELEALKASGKIKGYDFTTDKIAIKVAEGADAPMLPDKLNYIQIPNPNYYILSSSDWGYSKNQGTISRNEDIVVQYGSLISGIEYTVYYIEKGTFRNVAMPMIERVEATTTTVSASAIKIDNYALDAASPAFQTITLNPAISDNKIVFEYNYVGPGDTTTTTDETTYIAGGVATTYLETEVPTYVATTTAGGGGGAGGGGAAEGEAGGAEGEGAAEGEDAVAIPDGDIPLTAIPSDEGGSEEVIIEDSEVPLASPVEQKENWLVWIACILGAAIIIMGTTYIGIRNRKAKVLDYSDEVKDAITGNHEKE